VAKKNYEKASARVEKLIYISHMLEPIEPFIRNPVMRGIVLGPGTTNIRKLSGEILRKTGRYERAADEYRRILAADKDDFSTTFDLAWTAVLLGRYDDATTYYKTLLKLSRNDKDSYYYFATGNAFMFLGECAEAENAFRQSVQLGHPEKPVLNLVDNCRQTLRKDRK